MRSRPQSKRPCLLSLKAKRLLKPTKPPPNPPETLKEKPASPRAVSISSDEDEPRRQLLRDPAQQKRKQKRTANAAVEAELETYKTTDILPPWVGRRTTTGGESLPVELEVKGDHVSRSADSYDIELGEIISERKVQDDMEAGVGDVAVEYVFEYYHPSVLHAN